MNKVLDILEAYLEEEYEAISEYGPGNNNCKINDYISLVENMLKLKLITVNTHDEYIECINELK